MKRHSTNHHIFPTSRGGQSSLQSNNIIELAELTHQALHTLFGNKLLDEQILFLQKYDRKNLKRKKQDEIEELLATYPLNKQYNDGIIANPQIINQNIQPEAKNQGKIQKAHQKLFQRVPNTPEDKINSLIWIADSALCSEFENKLLNIIG